ncbi:MAG: DUF488 domain-containing protein [Armatimonadota bacterium]|nr:DUF488 domain-containing protein [Armatimonadota bacterium]
MKLYTIGHTKKNLRRFVELMRDAGVDAVVDIRLKNSSQLAGYSKGDDLAFVLEELLGIKYLHVLDLAPTEELLEQYRKDKDWRNYHAAFAELMRDRGAIAAAWKTLSAFKCPCLLCAEDDPQQCHRRVVAELLAADHPDTEVIHLR